MERSLECWGNQVTTWLCWLTLRSHVQKEKVATNDLFFENAIFARCLLVVWRFHHDILTTGGKLSFQNDLKPPRLEIATDGFPNIKIHSSNAGTRFPKAETT